MMTPEEPDWRDWLWIVMIIGLSMGFGIAMLWIFVEHGGG